jgi:dTDP-4-amino-4,6-dideoxygalactose transaminase
MPRKKTNKQSPAERLAIDGGPKVRTKAFPTRKLYLGEEKKAVLALFDQARREGHTVLGYNGPQEENYGREFAHFLGGGYADGVNSGTSAVYVALRALEIEPYGEVIVPPISDPGGIMPVPLCNLIPVVADAVPGSFNTGAEQIRARLTRRTRAIIVAHIAGIPVDMDPIMKLAAARGLPVIEDCAQAHGTKYKGRYAGSIGTLGAFSTMFGKHHSTGGQGGVVFTRSEALYWKVRQYADRGKPFGLTGTQGNVAAALNCNMDELHACLGRVQLRKLPAMVARRRALAARIAKGCRALRSVRLIADPPYGKSAYWFLIFRFEAAAVAVDKARFVAAAVAEGIPCNATYFVVPMLMEWFANGKVFGSSGLPWSAAGVPRDPPVVPNAKATDDTHFHLGFHEDWTDREADDIVAAFAKVEAAYA